MPLSSLSFPGDGLPSPPAPRGFWARLIASLVVPPRHSRGTSIAVVLGLCVLLGGAYVAMKGTVSMQGFYLVPLILAVSWLGREWGVFTAFLTAFLRMIGDYATAMIEPDYYFAAADLSRVVSNRVSGLLLFLVVVLVIHELIVLSRQLEERVRARTEALRQMIAARERLQNSLFEAGVRQRGVIGRDLHDGLGQHLTATAMAARILSSRLTSREDVLAADAIKVEALIKAGIDQTRQLARGLLLESVKPDELCAELEELAATTSASHRVHCQLTAQGQVERLDVNASSHLFYIAREALRNALRHAAATKIAIHLVVECSGAQLTVTDDGRGLNEKAPRDSGMGLHIMRQRAEFMGGTLSMESPAGIGTRIECRVPLPCAVAA